MCQRVELGVFKAFVVDKLDDLEKRGKRNNLVFWNIPEKSEEGIGCKNFIYNILNYQSNLEDP